MNSFRKKSKKKELPRLRMREAGEILEAVFRECGRTPNSVPIEALSSYTVYRKERFDLQRGFLIVLLVLFFLLPFLFIDSRYTVHVEEAGERRLPVYVIEVESLLPVGRVTARVNGQSLPVYEAGAKTFTVEPTRNGELVIDVALINRQNTTYSAEVTEVDDEGPELLESRVEGAEVLIRVRDEGAGVRFEAVYGITKEGGKVLPLRMDETAGLIVFAYPEEDLDVYIPDYLGNILHLAMKRSSPSAFTGRRIRGVFARF